MSSLVRRLTIPSFRNSSSSASTLIKECQLFGSKRSRSLLTHSRTCHNKASVTWSSSTKARPSSSFKPCTAQLRKSMFYLLSGSAAKLSASLVKVFSWRSLGSRPLKSLLEWKSVSFSCPSTSRLPTSLSYSTPLMYTRWRLPSR